MSNTRGRAGSIGCVDSKGRPVFKLAHDPGCVCIYLHEWASLRIMQGRALALVRPGCVELLEQAHPTVATPPQLH